MRKVAVLLSGGIDSLLCAELYRLEGTLAGCVFVDYGHPAQVPEGWKAFAYCGERNLRLSVTENVGIFVGGSTKWKEATMKAWGQLAVSRACWLHVARVNTVRRIKLCHEAGATSFDGSSVSRHRVNLPRLDAARRGVFP